MMTKPKLGFKLSVRNFKKKFLKNSSYLLRTQLTTFASLIMGVATIYLACNSNQLTSQSNNFAETALNLSRNDTSQQAQINQLRGILFEIKTQNDLARGQTAELIKITSEANKISSSTQNIMTGAKEQTQLMYQQLLFDKKTDSISDLNNILTGESDLLMLRKTFEEIRDVNMIRNVMLLALTDNPDISVVTDLRERFEKGLNNKIFLTDTIIQNNWYGFYQTLKIYEDEIKVYDAQGKPFSKNEAMKNIYKSIREKYFIYINRIWSRLDYLEKPLRKRNFK
jgi:hypothetical protein